jgi:DtxR family Mn-dependent transcriptional regulator
MSQPVEDYLKIIYKLQRQQGRVPTSAIAEKLGVTPPAATNMVQRLAELGLLRHTPYRGVELTEKGARIALEVIRHHRLWELFLARALNMPLDAVHAEAERLEHALSDQLEDTIDAALGHPTTDPHGDPIPTKEGRLEETRYAPLADLPAGARACVRRVPDSDAALLRYLTSLGLVPGAGVHILAVAPFNGPVHLRVGDQEHAISREVASRIFVEAVPDD